MPGSSGPLAASEGAAGVPGSSEPCGGAEGVTSRVSQGAASEMLACAHFLRRGFHVFRATSASCPVDLVVQAPGGPLIGVEVKSGRRYPKQGRPVFTPPANGAWTWLAVVDEAGEVYVLEDAKPGETTAQLVAHWHKMLGLVGDV